MLAKFVDSFHAYHPAFWFVLAEMIGKRLCFACVSCLLLASPFSAVAEGPRPNILFIAVDDLRSQLGCYGDADMRTPNIDRLAASSVLFEHHYVSVPICIPSRAGLLTGTRSERTRQTYGQSVWPKVTGIRTMGRTFGEAGYYTVSLGKIWHAMPGSDNAGERFDVRRPLGDPTYADPQLQHLLGKKDQLPAAEGPLDVPDEAYGDGLIANDAVRELGVGATSGKPLLMMVGFRKPHLPYNAPKKYWDLYNPDHPPGEPDRAELPDGAPALAARENHELWRYREGFSFANPPAGEAARRLRHAYAACVSYTDALIGKVLAELDRLDLRKNTIIVLWSDHGYHLGHLGQWTKLTNFEPAANSPLLISAPGLRPGARCALPVETCDIFPTLLDLCGLPPLAVTDGASLRPLLEDPRSAAWNRVAYHLVNRSGGERGKPIIGRAVRDTRFRYIEWHEGWEQTDPPVAVELYDYSPGAPSESRNLADDPALADQCERLHELLWNWTSQSTITHQ